jgi:hypothetical protein
LSSDGRAVTSLKTRMTSTPSPQGRRILVAVVTGETGRRIQAWREENDPQEAKRLPPHTTLCYWAPEASEEALGMQVRHAFEAPVIVRLGGVKQGDNDQETLFVEVSETEGLEAALRRLYDGSHVEMPALNGGWKWHVTCVRDTRERDLEALWRAAEALSLGCEWRLGRVSYLELRGERYEGLASWQV